MTTSATDGCGRAGDGPRDGRRIGLRLGGLDAVLFDVVAQVESESGKQPSPFTHQDYLCLVDGEARLDGVRHVLADRHVVLPDGSSADPPGLDSASTVAAAKDDRFVTLLRTKGSHPYAGSASLLRELRSAGLSTAVVSASRQCAEVFEVAGMDHVEGHALHDRSAPTNCAGPGPTLMFHHDPTQWRYQGHQPPIRFAAW